MRSTSLLRSGLGVRCMGVRTAAGLRKRSRMSLLWSSLGVRRLGVRSQLLRSSGGVRAVKRQPAVRLRSGSMRYRSVRAEGRTGGWPGTIGTLLLAYEA